jgi:hypothetical protein
LVACHVAAGNHPAAGSQVERLRTLVILVGQVVNLRRIANPPARGVHDASMSADKPAAPAFIRRFRKAA